MTHRSFSLSLNPRHWRLAEVRFTLTVSRPVPGEAIFSRKRDGERPVFPSLPKRRGSYFVLELVSGWVASPPRSKAYFFPLKRISESTRLPSGLLLSTAELLLGELGRLTT
jgi:hypothetical protein